MSVLSGLLAGFTNFLLYFSLSIAFVLAFKFIYVRLTPYDEWKLIKEHSNTAAAIALSGAFLGYCIAISGAAKNAISIGMNRLTTNLIFSKSNKISKPRQKRSIKCVSPS